MNKEQITAEVLAAFALPEGQLKELAPYGSGHINDTFRVTYETEKGQRRYILQRMNKNIFEKPVELMENIVHVTEWIKKKSEENGGDPERETLTVVCSGDGKPYYLDSEGQIISYDRISTSGTCPKLTQDWTSYSKEITAPTGAVSAQIGLLIGGTKMNETPDLTYYYDNIRLTESALLKEDLSFVMMQGGDATGEGVIDICDIIRIKRHQADSSVTISESADMNKNQRYDNDDLILLRWKILNLK